MTHIMGDFWITSGGAGYGLSHGDGGTDFGWRASWGDHLNRGDGYEHGHRDGNGFGVGIWANVDGGGMGGEFHYEMEMTPF